jgi:hypothetical protein
MTLGSCTLIGILGAVALHVIGAPALLGKAFW